MQRVARCGAGRRARRRAHPARREAGPQGAWDVSHRTEFHPMGHPVRDSMRDSKPKARWPAAHPVRWRAPGLLPWVAVPLVLLMVLPLVPLVPLVPRLAVCAAMQQRDRPVAARRPDSLPGAGPVRSKRRRSGGWGGGWPCAVAPPARGAPEAGRAGLRVGAVRWAGDGRRPAAACSGSWWQEVRGGARCAGGIRFGSRRIECVETVSPSPIPLA